MSQYQTSRICQRTINISNCAQKGTCLITKKETGKKDAYLFQHQGQTDKMDPEYLKNHV